MKGEIYSGTVLVLDVRKVIKVMRDQRSVFFTSLTSMEKEILFFLGWDKSVSLNCVFFFGTLRVHFLISLYFFQWKVTHNIKAQGPTEKKGMKGTKSWENW